MKIFVLFLSVFFVFAVVISPTYASEEVCTIEPSCTAKIEEEIDILKKKNAKLEKDAEESKEKMEKVAEENKGIMEDLIKRILCLENESAGKKCKNGGTSEKEKSTMTSPMTSAMTTPVPCPMKFYNKYSKCCPAKYENKCFIPVTDRVVNYDGGVAICERLGGQLANIYSQIHMDDVMKFIRERWLMDGSLSIIFRLGMKYDPKANKITLRDGSDASTGLKWHRGYPWTVGLGEAVAHRTNLILLVSSNQSSINQYLLDETPSFTWYALCEIADLLD